MPGSLGQMGCGGRSAAEAQGCRGARRPAVRHVARPMQQVVREALIAFMAATSQARAEATEAARVHGRSSSPGR
jgi:hypothetical protein